MSGKGRTKGIAAPVGGGPCIGGVGAAVKAQWGRSGAGVGPESGVEWRGWLC